MPITVTEEQARSCSLAELIWFRDFFRQASNWTAAAVIQAELTRRGFTA